MGDIWSPGSRVGETGGRCISPVSIASVSRKWLKEGTFNLGIMAKISILKFEGDYVLAKDGKHRLADGKTTVAALQRIQTIWKDEASRDTIPHWSQLLTEVMETGVMECRVVEYRYNDFKNILSHNSIAHDEKTNDLANTTALNMAELAHEFKKSTPGGKWDDVITSITATTGRRTYAWRCVTIAATTPDSVLMKADEYAIAASWIHDNKYFTGQHSRFWHHNRYTTLENMKIVFFSVSIGIIFLFGP